MRTLALIVPALAAALFIGGPACAQNTGAPAGKAAGAPAGPGAPASLGPSSPGRSNLGPVGGSSAGTPSPGASTGGGFGATVPGNADANATARSRIEAELRAARERMETKAKSDTRLGLTRLGLDAAAAQRAQTR